MNFWKTLPICVTQNHLGRLSAEVGLLTAYPDLKLLSPPEKRLEKNKTIMRHLPAEQAQTCANDLKKKKL